MLDEAFENVTFIFNTKAKMVVSLMSNEAVEDVPFIFNIKLHSQKKTVMTVCNAENGVV